MRHASVRRQNECIARNAKRQYYCKKILERIGRSVRSVVTCFLVPHFFCSVVSYFGSKRDVFEPLENTAVDPNATSERRSRPVVGKWIYLSCWEHCLW